METKLKETLIAKNMIIAQFMEVTPRLIAPDCYGLDKMPFWSITGDTPEKVLKDASLLLNYHNDWNQLMEVVEKIRVTEKCNDFNINYSCDAKIECEDYDKVFEVYTSNTINTLQAVYEACIEFIKWYNEKK